MTTRLDDSPVPGATVSDCHRGADTARAAVCPRYFGDLDEVFTTEELHVAPGFELPSSGLLCYCFGYTKADLEREQRNRTDGASSILETIRERTRAGECACEVRNPTGRCCLGEVARFQRSLTSGRRAEDPSCPSKAVSTSPAL